ncbi:MAG: hypothetical protein HPY76_10820, partial [Anaerolineae bacterium]|nr:hypothetical protein [Anaerolineae bacterium]
GWGYDCPDRYIVDFMIDGTLPEQREILCEDWGTDVTRAYEPLPPTDANAFADPLEAFQSFASEMTLQPEYFYGYFEEDVSVACPFGGAFTFGPSDVGEAYTFDRCAYAEGFAVSGSGGYDYGTGVFTIDATVNGLKDGVLKFVRDDSAGTYSLTGEYGGETVNME